MRLRDVGTVHSDVLSSIRQRVCRYNSGLEIRPPSGSLKCNSIPRYSLRHGLATFVDGSRLEWMGRGCQDLTTEVGKRRGLFAIEDTELNEGTEGFFEPKGDKGDLR